MHSFKNNVCLPKSISKKFSSNFYQHRRKLVGTERFLRSLIRVSKKESIASIIPCLRVCRETSAVMTYF